MASSLTTRNYSCIAKPLHICPMSITTEGTYLASWNCRSVTSSQAQLISTCSTCDTSLAHLKALNHVVFAKYSFCRCWSIVISGGWHSGSSPTWHKSQFEIRFYANWLQIVRHYKAVLTKLVPSVPLTDFCWRWSNCSSFNCVSTRLSLADRVGFKWFLEKINCC